MKVNIVRVDDCVFNGGFCHSNQKASSKLQVFFNSSILYDIFDIFCSTVDNITNIMVSIAYSWEQILGNSEKVQAQSTVQPYIKTHTFKIC